MGASVHGRTRDRERIEEEDTGQGSILYFSNSTERRFIGNVAIGLEYDLGNFDMRGGFLTNLSASPSVPDQTDEYGASRINLYGAAIAFEYDSERFHFSTGFTFQWGGEALGTFLDPIAGTVAYQSERAISRKLFFHLAGAFRAVAKAAGDVLRRNGDEDDGAGSGQ